MRGESARKTAHAGIALALQPSMTVCGYNNEVRGVLECGGTVVAGIGQVRSADRVPDRDQRAVQFGVPQPIWIGAMMLPFRAFLAI